MRAGLPLPRRARHADAVSHEDSCARAALVIIGGLPATGKSTIARLLAEQIRAAYIRVDTIEQAVVDSTSLAQPLGPVGYLIGYAVAGDQLRNGVSVVADSVNPLTVTRTAWRDVGARHAVRTVDVEIICSDLSEHRRRAETRLPSIPGLALPTWQNVLDREYEAWDPTPRIVIDTGREGVDGCVTTIRSRIGL